MPSRMRPNTTISVFDKNVHKCFGCPAKYNNICKRLINKKGLALFVCAQDTTIYYNICKCFINKDVPELFM